MRDFRVAEVQEKKGVLQKCIFILGALKIDELSRGGCKSKILVRFSVPASS